MLGSDTPPVREFITHNRNGLPGRLPRRASARRRNSRRACPAALDSNACVHAARAYAERHFDLGAHLRAFEAEIARLTDKQ